MNNLFLTGKKQVGKSTILKRIIDKLDISVGGYLTNRDFEGDDMAFTVLSLYDKVSTYTIARDKNTQPPRKIYLKTFKNDLSNLLEISKENRDLIIIDELGFMEEQVKEFKDELMKILDSPTPVFGILKDHNTPFLNKIKSRKDVKILEINDGNRNSLDAEIIEILKGFDVKFK